MKAVAWAAAIVAVLTFWAAVITLVTHLPPMRPFAAWSM